MKKQIITIALALATVFAGTSVLAAPKGKVDVSDIHIVDARGKAISIDQLPKEEQRKVQQVVKAAKGIQENGVKIKIGCSYPPLKCTITVEF